MDVSSYFESSYQFLLYSFKVPFRLLCQLQLLRYESSFSCLLTLILSFHVCSVAFVLCGCELSECELPSTDVLPRCRIAKAFPCGFIFVRVLLDFLSSGAIVMLVSVLGIFLPNGQCVFRTTPSKTDSTSPTITVQQEFYQQHMMDSQLFFFLNPMPVHPFSRYS